MEISGIINVSVGCRIDVIGVIHQTNLKSLTLKNQTLKDVLILYLVDDTNYGIECTLWDFISDDLVFFKNKCVFLEQVVVNGNNLN